MSSGRVGRLSQLPTPASATPTRPRCPMWRPLNHSLVNGRHTTRCSRWLMRALVPQQPAQRFGSLRPPDRPHQQTASEQSPASASHSATRHIRHPSCRRCPQVRPCRHRRRHQRLHRCRHCRHHRLRRPRCHRHCRPLPRRQVASSRPLRMSLSRSLGRAARDAWTSSSSRPTPRAIG